MLWMDYPSPNRAARLASELERLHAQHYMVWNVSGSGPSYDTEIFGGQVVQLRFNGYLCPPLLMLLEACASIHAWLRADPANVVAVHCKSGRGRSAVVLCCALAWQAAPGGEGPRIPLDWLSHLAQLRGVAENELTLRRAANAMCGVNETRAYTNHELQLAVLAVIDGKSRATDVQSKYGIPAQTFKRYKKG